MLTSVLTSHVVSDKYTSSDVMTTKSLKIYAGAEAVLSIFRMA